MKTYQELKQALDISSGTLTVSSTTLGQGFAQLLSEVDPDIAEPSAMRTDADAIARGEVPLWYPYDEFTRPCEEIAADVRALAELLDA